MSEYYKEKREERSTHLSEIKEYFEKIGYEVKQNRDSTLEIMKDDDKIFKVEIAIYKSKEEREKINQKILDDLAIASMGWY